MIDRTYARWDALKRPLHKGGVTRYAEMDAVAFVAACAAVNDVNSVNTVNPLASRISSRDSRPPGLTVVRGVARSSVIVPASMRPATGFALQALLLGGRHD